MSNFPPLCLLLLAFLLSLLAVGQTQPEGSPDRYTETITTDWGDQISFEMVRIPASSFLMGSPEQEEGRNENEGPQLRVELSPYYLATTETTLELFLAYYRETHAPAEDFFPGMEEEVDTVTGPTPVYGDITMGRSEQHPAIGMTWKNAVTFCRWLSRKTGREYRLPTEAEWENACRCGTTQGFGIGDSPDELEIYARFGSSPSAGTHEVGTKKANNFGLFDLQGNVSEWVHDFYAPDAYAEMALENPVQDPLGPESGKVHVARGGDYRSPSKGLRCAARNFEKRWWRSGDPQLPKSQWWLPDMDHIGFRVARSAAQ
jgi:formylglycine-generating enzyme required for sulfatase activity